MGMCSYFQLWKHCMTRLAHLRVIFVKRCFTLRRLSVYLTGCHQNMEEVHRKTFRIIQLLNTKLFFIKIIYYYYNIKSYKVSIYCSNLGRVEGKLPCWVNQDYSEKVQHCGEMLSLEWIQFCLWSSGWQINGQVNEGNDDPSRSENDAFYFSPPPQYEWCVGSVCRTQVDPAETFQSFPKVY